MDDDNFDPRIHGRFEETPPTDEELVASDVFNMALMESREFTKITDRTGSWWVRMDVKGEEVYRVTRLPKYGLSIVGIFANAEDFKNELQYIGRCAFPSAEVVAETHRMMLEEGLKPGFSSKYGQIPREALARIFCFSCRQNMVNCSCINS